MVTREIIKQMIEQTGRKITFEDKTYLEIDTEGYAYVTFEFNLEDKLVGISACE